MFVSSVLTCVVGCNAQPTKLPQPTKPSYVSSVELGKTFPQVWFAANKPWVDLISESLNNGYKEEVYRFWFDHTYSPNDTVTKYDPYLLTFRDCNIADYAAVRIERKRRADAWLASNPDMAKKVEKFIQEQGFSQTSKEFMIEMLAPGIYSGLPRPGANSVLVKIDYDAESVAKQYQHRQMQRINQNMEDIQNQLDQMEHKASFDRMQRGGLP